MRDDDERLAVEIAQFVQHLHDIADVLVERMRGMTEPDAEAFLEDALTRLAVGAKRLEATTGVPDIASSVGYKISAVIRTRVEGAAEGAVMSP